MRFNENITDNTNLFIDECQATSSLPKNHHPSIQYSSLVQEHIPYARDNKSSPSSENMYTEIVKAIGDNHLLKRASWAPVGQQGCGLPPTGKRTDGAHSTIHKTSNRIGLRPQTMRHSQSKQPHQISLVRPLSFNEKYDYLLTDRFSNQSLNRNGSLSNLRCEPSPTSSSSSSSIDTILQITTRASPSFDNSDFISDTSSVSSVTTTNTITSLPSAIQSRRKNSLRDRIYSSVTRPLLNEYRQKDLSHIDYKLSSPVSKTNIDALSSPISSLRSSTSFSPTSFTCPKGHEESSSSSSSSPIGSSLNQYTGFTSQTSIIDSSRDDIGHPTTTIRSMMTMSISPNRHHNQTYSTNPINTSISSMTNNNDGLNQQQDQTESTIVSGGCLKSNRTHINQKKKSVRFDWHLPVEIRSSSPSARSNYRLPVTVTSSSMFTSNSDNEEQKKKNPSETVEQKKKNETTRRTIVTTTTTTVPLTTNTIHRSFSLSPSPPSKKENNDSRRPRQEKKENVDELNYTTSRRVTTAPAHLYCTANTATVTSNDGNSNISSNGTNNFQTNENLTHSLPNKHMPLNNLLAKTSSVNPQTTTTKRFIGNGGFLSFINRSNSTNNTPSSTDENKHLRRTSSTQRKSKQHATYENKRLSANVESLQSSGIIWKEDIDKVITNHQNEERQSTTDNNTDPSIPQYTNMNRSSISMPMNSTTTTIKTNIGDSLNNGLLFQPMKKEPFFLSPLKSLSNNDESSIGKMMQTSTLIISTPPQYHYYLYPPSSTVSKKNLTPNRTISNVSMNSISTNSSSSSSYESQIHDLDDDTSSNSIYTVNNQNRILQSRTKSVRLSDSVQAFWAPRSSSMSNNDLEQIKKMVSTVEQNKHSNLINHKHKQFESNTMKNNVISSTYNDDSLSISNGNQTVGLLPTTSLMLNNDEEVRSYSEPNSFNNGSLRIVSDTSFEDTQASYSERLREKSRSITATTNRLLTMNVNNSSLSRSRSKDALNNQMENFDSMSTNISRPKSAGQQALNSSIRQEIFNDFQSKRQFFENRTYTEHSPISTNTKVYTLPPASPTINNNNQQRPVIKQPPSSDSMIRTTKYFDSSSNQASLPPTVYRKPVRIVKAVQRSVPSPSINEIKPTLPTKMNSTDDFKTLSSPHSNELIMNNDQHLSSEYVRNLFPIPDHLKRNRSRQNSSSNPNNDIRTVSNDNVRPTDDLLLNLTKRLEILKENQRIINDEIEINTVLGTKLINIIQSKGELNEIEKFKLHINEIDTITSVLLKLSSRLAKVENDLLMITDDNDQTKASLIERREKNQQKHDEAKSLKDGIDRRSRLLVTNILQKYLSDEEFDEYDHFIRMKSTLLIDAKDIEENIALIQKQIQILLNTSSSIVNNQQYSSTSSVSILENLHRSNSTTSSSSNNVDNIQTNYFNAISTTA